MFARSILRCSAAPMRTSVRRYATGPEPPKSGGSSLPYILGLGAVGAGGYYYYANFLGKAPQIPNLPAPAQEKGQNPQGPSPPSSQDAKTFMGGDQGFLPLKLAKVEDINHNTKKFIFHLDDPEHIAGLPTASAVITKFKPGEKEKPVIRPYTPTSDPNDKGYLEFVIKKYPDGPMSEHIHSMKVGDTLDVKGPIPKYPWSANKHEHIGLIAGGTGITPMWQLIRAIFNNPEDKTKVTLIFGNISKEDILLKEEFDKIENTYPQRFRAFYVLDKPPQGWEQGKGFITKDLLKTLLPEPKEKNLKLFICGPPGLYKAISGVKKSPQDQGELDGYLKELGYEKDQVYKF